MNKALEADYDIVVIGSGAAGMTAALTASFAGMRTLLIEKTKVVGGTTSYSEAMIWVPCSAQARALGVADSADAALDYLRAVAGNKLDTERARAYIDAAPVMLAFLEANSQVRYSLSTTSLDYYADEPGATVGARALNAGKFEARQLGRGRFAQLRRPLASATILGGMSIAGTDLGHFYRFGRAVKPSWQVIRLVARYVMDRFSGWPRNTLLGNGDGVIAALWHANIVSGTTILTTTAAHKLLVDEGRVTGIIANQNDRELTITTRRGVILAAGGFTANPKLRQHYAPGFDRRNGYVQLTAEGATGDALTLAGEAGAAIHSDLDQPMAWAPTSWVPHRKAGFPHFIERAKPGVIMVNQDGERFANEAMPYHDIVPAMAAASRSGEAVGCWIIADHRAQRTYGLGASPPWPMPLGPDLRSGYLVKGTDLDELARKIGVDPVRLTATIAAFNRDAENGRDTLFARGQSAFDRAYGDPEHDPNPCLGPLSKGPFYAVRLRAGDIGSFVGLATNADGQVLNSDRKPIAGLYAAGLDAANAMGGHYPAAGVTVGAAMTFGWLAARHAAGIGDHSTTTGE
ncbi:MAG: FAD-dependent oxidoreductase [Sphingorhabdus sp.]